MQSIDGVLIVAPSKMPSISLPFLVNRKIFGSGHGAGPEDLAVAAALLARRGEGVA